MSTDSHMLTLSKLHTNELQLGSHGVIQHGLKSRVTEPASQKAGFGGGQGLFSFGSKG